MGDVGNPERAEIVGLAFARACGTKLLRRITLTDASIGEGLLLDASASAIDPGTGESIELRLFWRSDRHRVPAQWVEVARRHAPFQHLPRHLPHLLGGLHGSAKSQAVDWITALSIISFEAERVCRHEIDVVAVRMPSAPGPVDPDVPRALMKQEQDRVIALLNTLAAACDDSKPMPPLDRHLRRV